VVNNLPGDPAYYSPHAQITPESELVLRDVSVKRNEDVVNQLVGASSALPYLVLEDYLKSELQDKLNDCSFFKKKKDSDANAKVENVYYVDVDVEAVLFNEDKKSKQVLGEIFFGALAKSVTDKENIKYSISIYDLESNLSAQVNSDPIILESTLAYRDSRVVTTIGVNAICNVIESGYLSIHGGKK
jgi:hypothetical protein